MDPPSFNSQYECVRFEIYCFVRNQGIYFYRHTKIRQVSLEKSVQYLDLALEPCRHNWKTTLKFEIMKRLSLTCAEYFVAESEIPSTGSFETMFHGMNSAEKMQLLIIKNKLSVHVEDCYSKFTSVFFKRFESLDQSQKKSNCRSLLKVHRILQIKHFQIYGLKSLILVAICPEPDPELTVEILRVICVTPFLKVRSFFAPPYRSLQTMFSNAKSMGFDFWGLWRGVGIMSTNYNLIAELVTRDMKLRAIILLQHGFPFLCSFNIYETQCSKFLQSRIRAKVNFARNCYTKLLAKPNMARMMLTLITYLAVSESMEETLPDDTVATLRCLMRSLPDPYVLPTDMCNELKPYFTAASTEHIESVCRKYQECGLYTEDYTVYKPRKLEHLCRCVIRRVLAGYWRLPEGIYQLGMPPPIIKYLSLDS